MVLVQSSFHTTLASLFEMVLEPNTLDWNENKLEHELELEDMKRTNNETCLHAFYGIRILNIKGIKWTGQMMMKWERYRLEPN